MGHLEGLEAVLLELVQVEGKHAPQSLRQFAPGCLRRPRSVPAPLRRNQGSRWAGSDMVCQARLLACLIYISSQFVGQHLLRLHSVAQVLDSLAHFMDGLPFTSMCTLHRHLEHSE